MTNNWQKVKLSDVVKDFVVPMRDKPKVFSGNVPWCRIEDFSGIFLSDSKSKQYVNEQIIKEMQLRVYPVNTVLVSCSADLGRCAITTKPLVTNQTFIGLVPSDKIDSLFLYYLMSASSIRLNDLASGTTISYLSRKQFEKLSVNVPLNLSIQRKIASILLSIDEVIQKTDQIIQKSEELKSGLMNELLTRGIGHTKFKRTKLGEIPEEWSVISLQDLINTGIITSHLDGNHGELYPKSSEFTDKGIPYISANNLTNNRVDFTRSKYLSEARAKLFKKGVAVDGDVLFAHNATVGPVALLKTNYPFVILSTSLTYYRCNVSKLNPEYLLNYMQSDLFKAQYQRIMSQTTRNQVPITAQRILSHILPPIEEQNKIANILSSIEAKISNNVIEKTELLRLKKSLMQDIFNQKVQIS